MPTSSPTGRDDRGRKQYLYHPDWRAAADLAKFERLGDVGRCLGTLRKAVDHDLRARTEEWPTAAMVRLIDLSLIRPGSRRNLAEHGSVGATTLGAEHVSVDGRRITLDFDGKSAVEQHVEIEDLLLARRLSSLIDDERLDGLFVDRDDTPVDASTLNDYIARHTECDMTAKFLRTWGATCAAAGFLLGVTRLNADDTDDDGDARIRRAVEYTADRLGNTRGRLPCVVHRPDGPRRIRVGRTRGTVAADRDERDGSVGRSRPFGASCNPAEHSDVQRQPNRSIRALWPTLITERAARVGGQGRVVIWPFVFDQSREMSGVHSSPATVDQHPDSIDAPLRVLLRRSAVGALVVLMLMFVSGSWSICWSSTPRSVTPI